MKILELGAQSNDTFNSMIENAECHGKRGIPGKRLIFLLIKCNYLFSALIESMGLDQALTVLDRLKADKEKQSAIRDRLLS